MSGRLVVLGAVLMAAGWCLGSTVRGQSIGTLLTITSRAGETLLAMQSIGWRDSDRSLDDLAVVRFPARLSGQVQLCAVLPAGQRCLTLEAFRRALEATGPGPVAP